MGENIFLWVFNIISPLRLNNFTFFTFKSNNIIFTYKPYKIILNNVINKYFIEKYLYYKILFLK